MSQQGEKQSGFTAIELLITLFVAAAFLIAGYQLFNVVIKDGGQSRAESRAGNVAYDYMRRYSPSATNPCSELPLLSNSPVNIDGLSNAKITVVVSCPPYSTPSLSKIDVTITYGSPQSQQTVKYSSYVNGSSTQTADVTDGLLSWWKFNGDANSAIGSAHGTVTNAIPTTSQNGSENGAYYLNGTNAKISLPLTSLPTSISTMTISVWVKQPTAQAIGMVATNPLDLNNVIAIFVPSNDNNTYWYFGTNGGGSLVTAHQVGWLNTWNFWTFTSSSSGGMKTYRNGSLVGSNSSTGTFTKGTKTFDIGTRDNTNWWSGTIDDMRIYDRVLNTTEITTLYSAGAK